MRWGSFDTFLVDDSFWQDKMGKPLVNKEFLGALLSYGTFENYHFFCTDSHHLSQFRNVLDGLISEENRKRVTLSLQAQFAEEISNRPIDVIHQGERSQQIMPALIPSFQKNFSHFPSRVLRQDSRVTLSEYGKMRCQQRFQPIIYEDMATMLDDACRAFLIEFLSGSDRTIEELIEEGSGKGYPGDTLLLHLDSLIKHGYVTVMPDNPTTTFVT
ncbi:MAG: hypothetical protein IMF10_07720 [Proteobacteria bacterium]|nr:hypothetical protein [Pseudomonadota bacterium]